MSKIEVNTVDVQCGSTLTLGSSGKTVAIASGASTSGMGRTGTVDWCTTAKTSPFTAENGKGYFVNTTSGAITVTLPSSPSAGDIIAIKDYANTFDTNNVTIGRGGSKINGNCDDATLNTESQSVTLIYVDGTKGWQSIQDGTSNVTGASFIIASGGTETTSGDYKIHTFNSDANFVVSNAGSSSGSNTVSYMVVAGGGGGGKDRAGGGGAGGFRESKASTDSYTASPLNATSGPTYNLPVSAQTYPITVGAGGAGVASPGSAVAGACSGSNSVFSTITSAGGGYGGSGPGPKSAGANGGSGGGSDAYGYPSSPSNMAAGSGNTPPVSPPQGNNGSLGFYNFPNGSGTGGGGGGATANATASPGSSGGGSGGAGATTEISASPVIYAGGGGGATCTTAPPTVAIGGPGGGGDGGSPNRGPGANGTTNRGGGGGGGGGSGPYSGGGNGGSGTVIIRYKFQ